MSDVKVRGLNHLTLAVTDLTRAVRFYRDVLGCDLRAIWADGAYLEAGSLWLCLSVDELVRSDDRRAYTHYAFDVAEADFEVIAERVREQALSWKGNKSEGASLYFLDPDGHRLELHIGSLASRLEAYQANPTSGVTIV
jgi:catechol 2,3-dioxygenase-like lactoylglutathione lyase family enzyme